MQVLKFIFTPALMGYVVQPKVDQDLLVQMYFDECGNFRAMYLREQEFLEENEEYLAGVSVLINGEWVPLNAIKEEAEAHFGSLLAEYKQEEADEAAHMIQLQKTWEE